jgi:hypothetical protein
LFNEPPTSYMYFSTLSIAATINLLPGEWLVPPMGDPTNGTRNRPFLESPPLVAGPVGDVRTPMTRSARREMDIRIIIVVLEMLFSTH